MNNFKDIYIRTNPRRNAKINPVMWDDNTSRYFTHQEGFTGDYKNVTGDLYNVGGATNVSSYSNINSKVETRTTQVKCKNGKANVMVNDNGNMSKKMYDISPEAIMNNKILGNIDEVDKIHNNKVIGSMSYDRMMLNHFQNTTNRLHSTVNPLVLSYHNRVLENDPFFNPK